ncbi:ArsR/SmtB family transcription factor, partial [Bacillus sp. D-CC]
NIGGEKMKYTKLQKAGLNIPIAKSTLSHHFKVLRESGVMYTRLEGTQRFISIREDDLNARFPGLLDVIIHATEPY